MLPPSDAASLSIKLLTYSAAENPSLSKQLLLHHVQLPRQAGVYVHNDLPCYNQQAMSLL